MATSPEAGDGAELERALRTARSLLDLGHSEDIVFGSGLIDASMVESVRTRLAAERTQVLTPVRVFRANADQADWLAGLDRSRWHYWTALRQYLLTVKGWSAAAVRRLSLTGCRRKHLAGSYQSDFAVSESIAELRPSF